MFNLHFDGHPRLYDPHENVPRAKKEASPIKHFSHLKKTGWSNGEPKKLVSGWKHAKLRCHISDLCFRHETPVLSKPIEVVHLSEELVVLDKPCSLPVSLYFNLSCDKKGKVDMMMRFVCFFHVYQPTPTSHLELKGEPLSGDIIRLLTVRGVERFKLQREAWTSLTRSEQVCPSIDWECSILFLSLLLPLLDKNSIPLLSARVDKSCRWLWITAKITVQGRLPSSRTRRFTYAGAIFCLLASLCHIEAPHPMLINIFHYQIELAWDENGLGLGGRTSKKSIDWIAKWDLLQFVQVFLPPTIQQGIIGAKSGILQGWKR